CFNCGQKGHMSRMCPTKKKGNGGRFQKGGWKGKGKPSQSIRKCFNCGQKGHMSRMCPTKKKGNGGRFQKGGWKGKGKPSQSIRSAET
ncbi:hypothetical protein M378DRAFT_57898, partial [Amanita muscaria Koide BX008]